MGNNIFGANISGKLASALGAKLLPVILIKRLPTERTPGQPSSGTNPSKVTYQCRGFGELSTKLTNQGVGMTGGSRVKKGDGTISILGDTIAGGKVKPEPNDEIVFQGKSYTIAADGVASDPDAAMYICTIRG